MIRVGVRAGGSESDSGCYHELGVSVRILATQQLLKGFDDEGSVLAEVWLEHSQNLEEDAWRTRTTRRVV